MAKNCIDTISAVPAGEGRREARSAQPFWRRAGRLLGRGLDILYLWQSRHEERRLLLTMEEHILKDIGLSRADIERESAKPFWRP